MSIYQNERVEHHPRADSMLPLFRQRIVPIAVRATGERSVGEFFLHNCVATLLLHLHL